MSIQNGKLLYCRLLTDDKFRNQIEQAVNFEERYQILQDAGFSCTKLELKIAKNEFCLLYTSPSPRDKRQSRMPSSA